MARTGGEAVEVDQQRTCSPSAHRLGSQAAPEPTLLKARVSPPAVLRGPLGALRVGDARALDAGGEGGAQRVDTEAAPAVAHQHGLGQVAAGELLGAGEQQQAAVLVEEGAVQLRRQGRVGGKGQQAELLQARY